MILKFANSQPLVGQVPPALLEAPKEAGGQGEKAEDLQDKGKGLGKKKSPSKPKDQAPDAAATQSSQTVDPIVSTKKA
nr:hypothetical protein CFP56_05434 [Quercus suber]